LVDAQDRPVVDAQAVKPLDDDGGLVGEVGELGMRDVEAE
jgi:hypothetical protein